MSKNQPKRGFVRSQPAAQIDPAKVEAFERAWEAFEAQRLAFESSANGTTQAMTDAADVVFSTPAPDGAALARKLALFAFPMHVDGWLHDPAVRANVAMDDDEEAKRLLVMYLDALALGGVTATAEAPRLSKTAAQVADEYEAAFAAEAPFIAALEKDEDAPAIPGPIAKRYARAERELIATRAADLRGVALKVGLFAMQLEGIDVYNPKERSEALAGDGIGKLIVQLYDRLAGLKGLPLSDVPEFDWFMLCLCSEGIAKMAAAEEWSEYAINPEGLLRLVEILASFQRDLRSLAREGAPGACGAALQSLFENRFPWEPEPGAEAGEAAH